ncbi:uncharacterized protein [Hyperolius riggenbachi]|uniref:uncharacterized protein n=1 Tax=Hyperolius riggenbachi TaxID=752182 RepID=UPI0035A345D9
MTSKEFWEKKQLFGVLESYKPYPVNLAATWNTFRGMLPRKYPSHPNRNWKCSTVPSTMGLWKPVILILLLAVSRTECLTTAAATTSSTTITSTILSTNTSDSNTSLTSLTTNATSTLISTLSSTVSTSLSTPLTSSPNTFTTNTSVSFSSSSTSGTQNSVSSSALSTLLSASSNNSTLTSSATVAVTTLSSTNTISAVASSSNTSTISAVPSTTNSSTISAVPSTTNTSTISAVPSTSNASTILAVPSTTNSSTISAVPSTTNTSTISAVPSTSNASTISAVPSTTNTSTISAVPSTSNASTISAVPSTTNTSTISAVQSTTNTSTISAVPSTSNTSTISAVASTSNTSTISAVPSTSNTSTISAVPSTSNTSTISAVASTSNTSTISAVPSTSNTSTISAVASTSNTSTISAVPSTSNTSTISAVASTSNTSTISAVPSTSNTSSSTTISSSSTTANQTTTVTPIVSLPLEFKITNKNFTDALKNKSSSEFLNLKKTVEEQLSTVYKAKYPNFQSINVTDFSNGSVVVASTVQFASNDTAPAPSSENTVRALLSSLQGNSSVGDFQLSPESITSNNINLTNLPPYNISVNFLAQVPYDTSTTAMLTNQTVLWVQNTLLTVLNGTVAAAPITVFTNNASWTSATAYFIINSNNLLDPNIALNSLIGSRVQVNFTLVPNTLTVAGTALSFTTISQQLRITNISLSSNLSSKYSSDFQTTAKAIKDSFRDIYGQTLVEAVVTGFTNTDSFAVTALVDLYFQNISITSASVTQTILNNTATFKSRYLVLDPLQLNPQVGVRVNFTLIQNSYTSGLANISSTEAMNLQTTVLNVITPILQQVYNTSLQTSPSVSFTNATGFAAVSIPYVLNYTIGTGIADATAFRALQNNTGVSSLIRMSTLYVNNINLNNLPPYNISVNFLAQVPYDTSTTAMLTNQTVLWVQNTLLTVLNGTVAVEPTTFFTNNANWTSATAYFSINSSNVLYPNIVLNSLIGSRVQVNFSIVPNTLTVAGTTLSFTTISQQLRITNISLSSNLSSKYSSDFQTTAKAIKDSFRDIYPQNLVEPVVTGFTNTDSFAVTALVDLYFQNISITSASVTQTILNNTATFKSRYLVLDPFQLNPKVGVQVNFTLIQEYTSGLANISSTEAMNLQTTVLSVITPILQQLYNTSLQPSPSVSFTNANGFAAVSIPYVLNYTMGTGIADTTALSTLQNNAGFSSMIRMSTLYVNNVKTSLDVLTFSPRFLNTEFTSDLYNRNSQKFKDLENTIKSGFGKILQNFRPAQIVVNSFKPGSVIAQTELTFPQGAASSSAVAQQLANNRDVLQSLGLNLDTQSLVSSPTPVTYPAESSFPGYAVAIIVMCILAILCIPLLVVVALKTDLCQKLRNACSLKPPYESTIRTGFTDYRTHSYDLN